MKEGRKEVRSSEVKEGGKERSEMKEVTEGSEESEGIEGKYSKVKEGRK